MIAAKTTKCVFSDLQMKRHLTVYQTEQKCNKTFWITTFILIVFQCLYVQRVTGSTEFPGYIFVKALNNSVGAQVYNCDVTTGIVDC